VKNMGIVWRCPSWSCHDGKYGPRIFQYLKSAPVQSMAWLRIVVGLVVGCGLTLAARAQEAPQNAIESNASGFVIRSQSNLIVVPVIVRDADGKVVSGLTRDDFEVFDNKKPQTISHFSVETPEDKNSPDTIAKGTRESAPKTLPQAAAPQRFIGIFFERLPPRIWRFGPNARSYQALPGKKPGSRS
jgi:hypothetical protein